MRRTDAIEAATLEYFFGRKAIVMPSVWWLQFCTSAPSDSQAGSIPTVDSGLSSRRRISNGAVTWGFNGSGHRINRFVIFSSTAKETVSNLGWFELWDSSVGGVRWFHGIFVDPLTEDPVIIQIPVGKRARFNKGSLRIKEE